MVKFTAKMSTTKRREKMRTEMDFWKREQLPDGRYHLISTSMKEIEEAEFVKSICTDSWSYTFWYGVVSEFPLCCVMFFCDVWHYWRKEKRMFSDGESKDWKFHLGYVPCPDCAITCMCIRNPEQEKELKENLI